MQEFDVDLGEVDDSGGSVDIRDGTLTTRTIVQHVVGCLAEGDTGWLRLWTAAYEQEHARFLEMASAADSTADANGMLHTLRSMSTVCSSDGVGSDGVDSGPGSELRDLTDSAVAQYDQHTRQFVVVQPLSIGEPASGRLGRRAAL